MKLWPVLCLAAIATLICVVESGSTDVAVRVKRQTAADQAKNSIEIFSQVLNIGSDVIDYVPVVGDIINKFIGLIRLIVGFIYDALWGSQDLFSEIQALVVRTVRKEIDAAFAKKATTKIIDYQRRIRDMFAFLFSNETKHKFDTQVSDLLKNNKIGSSSLMTLLNATNVPDNSRTVVPHDFENALLLLSNIVATDRSHFEFANYPNSTSTQYSRFAMIDVMLKIMLFKVKENQNYKRQAKESAEIHIKYLWKSIHWIAAEAEIEETASMTGDQLRNFAYSQWKTETVYEVNVNNLASSKSLGVRDLAQASQLQSEYFTADFLHHGDIIALRSLVQTSRYISYRDVGKTILKTCEDNTDSLQVGNSLICSDSFFIIYTNGKGAITTGARVALEFQHNEKYLLNTEGKLLCDTYSLSYLKDGEFDEPAKKSVKFQFEIAAKGRKDGEQIMDRDAVLLRQVDGGATITARDHDQSDAKLLVADEDNDYWRVKDTFRVFKSGSTYDPGHTLPPTSGGNGSANAFNVMIALFLVGVTFTFK